jgi:hypothetical protein
MLSSCLIVLCEDHCSRACLHTQPNLRELSYKHFVTELIVSTVSLVVLIWHKAVEIDRVFVQMNVLPLLGYLFYY